MLQFSHLKVQFSEASLTPRQSRFSRMRAYCMYLLFDCESHLIPFRSLTNQANHKENGTNSMEQNRISEADIFIASQ
jgi:hypothetical protein